MQTSKTCQACGTSDSPFASYGYDNANRLLTINHVKTPTTIEALTYQYDTASNRVSLNRANAAASLIPAAVSSNSYDAANEQTQFNGVTQTFDANGNFTNDGTNIYTWDSRNRLTGISGGVTATFVYDGLGRRKSKTIGGTTTGFWYDGNDVLAELSSGTPSATYIRGLSIDESYIRKGASDELYQADALGSAVALTNGAGAGQTTYTYEPFGKTTQAGTASTNPFQYTGRENDGTGLYYFRARYYHPKLQRFIREDPLGFGGGDLNLYSYVSNAPARLVDPMGLSAIDDINLFVESWDWNLSLQGLEAFADGVIPLIDPFAEGGMYNPCNPYLAYNKGVGLLTRDIELFLLLRKGASQDGWLFGKSSGLLNQGRWRVGWGMKHKVGAVFRVGGPGRDIHYLDWPPSVAAAVGYTSSGALLGADVYLNSSAGCKKCMDTRR